MDKKNGNKIILMLICALLLVFLTACQPGHYTKKHRKELNKLHKSDAKAWFETNLPDARCSPGSIMADGIDLMQAVQGTYTAGTKKAWNYVYDYVTDTMYLESLYGEVCSRVAEAQAMRLKVSPAMTETGFFGCEATFMTDNDNGDPQMDPDDPNGPVTKLIEALPWGTDPAEFAEQVLEGSIEFDYYTRCYVTEIPPYEHDHFDTFPNLTSVSYLIPASLDFEGIYSVTYLRDEALYHNIKLNDLNGRLIGGYIWTDTQTFENGAPGEWVSQLKEPAFDPVYTGEEGGKFSLQVPLGARPVIFTEEKGELYRTIRKSNGETSESEQYGISCLECDRFRSGMIFYSRYPMLSGGDLLLPGSMKCFSTEMGTAAKGGTYLLRLGEKIK